MTHVASKPARGTDVPDTRFEQLLDSDEAASLLKIHPKSLQQMARSGEIAGVRIGKLWRFRASFERLARAQNGELNSTAFAWGNPRQDFHSSP